MPVDIIKEFEKFDYLEFELAEKNGIFYFRTMPHPENPTLCSDGFDLLKSLVKRLGYVNIKGIYQKPQQPLGL